ncbi:MAG: glycosyltransferase [Kofleriaceae bacterium]
MTISVIVETWNASDRLAHLLATLAPQVAAADAEVVITHAGISSVEQRSLDRLIGRSIRWLDLGTEAGYYDHKNRGFDVSTGDIVAFIDGDCSPVATWLAALTRPIVDGERVVAGATSYPGALGALANQIDFPYFDREGAQRRTIADAPHAVRNFFANNVAFARAEFAGRRYPAIEPMFHGQCQVLALQLLADDVPIRFAPAARVTHAWPDGVRDWVTVRLLRGADTVSLLPYVLGRYAPKVAGPVARLGSLPSLAIFGVRALAATWTAVTRGPLLRGLGFVAMATVLDSIGAAAAPAVYRYVA